MYNKSSCQNSIKASDTKLLDFDVFIVPLYLYSSHLQKNKCNNAIHVRQFWGR